MHIGRGAELYKLANLPEYLWLDPWETRSLDLYSIVWQSAAWTCVLFWGYSQPELVCYSGPVGAWILTASNTGVLYFTSLGTCLHLSWVHLKSKLLWPCSCTKPKLVPWDSRQWLLLNGWIWQLPRKFTTNLTIMPKALARLMALTETSLGPGWRMPTMPWTERGHQIKKGSRWLGI